MNLADLNKVALAMVAPGKGILAADESVRHHQEALRRHQGRSRPSSPAATIAKCCSAPTEAMNQYISGVILYDETIWQDAKDGTPLIKLIEQSGAIPGIKVDEGTQALPGCPGELVTAGLDKLAERLKKYYERGARFAKWRAVIDIGQGIPIDDRDPRQRPCAGALRRAVPGRADRPDRRAGSADGRRSRHRPLL